MTIKLRNIFTLLLAASLLMTSCKEENDQDEELEVGATMTVNGTSYDIAQAYFTYWAPTENFNYKSGAISLITEGVEVESSNGYDSFTGEGYLMIINLVSESTSVDFPEGPFTDASAYFYQVDSKWTRIEYSTAASLTITKSGENYVITGTMEDNETQALKMEISFEGTFTDLPNFGW